MIVFTVFSLCLFIQLAYLALLSYGFGRARSTSTRPAASETPPISVIVAARNEAHNLPALLDALAAQDYSAFEVVIVDDGSTDATPDLVRIRAALDPRFRPTSVQPAEPRKKNALAAGIEEARYDLLAFTDADCEPPPGWLSSIAAVADGGEAIVVGYSPFRRAATSVNNVSRYETMVTGFLTAAAIGLGRPYMAVGRNLSYSKTVFRRIGGFTHSAHLLSGDDDLLVQHAARMGIPCVPMLTSRSHVPTRAPAGWLEWLRQKRRHTSAARSYRASVQAHLMAYHTTAHALWLAPFFLGIAGAGLLAARLIVLWASLVRPAVVLRERDLLTALPLWELAYALYNVVIAPVGLAFRPRRWRTGSERQDARQQDGA